MAGRGRGRANTLPAWMTKQGVVAPPPGPAVISCPPSTSQCPPVRNGQFEDAPEPAPRGSGTRPDMGDSSSGKRRSRSREYGNGRKEKVRSLPPVHDSFRSQSRDRGYSRDGNARSPPPAQVRPRSRSRSRNRGNGRDRSSNLDADRRWEGENRRGPPHGRSRSRERQYYRGDSRRGGDDRHEDRGYGYRRDEGRPTKMKGEAIARGYRRTVPHGHDDRTSRRYASDYKP